MSIRSNSFFVPGMVYVGAVGLVGLPVMAVSLSFFADILSVVNGPGVLAEENWFESAVFLSVYFVSILIGLQVAVEAAALQLGGIEALGRGSRLAVLLRHLGLSLAAVVVLVWATTFGATAFTGASNPATVVAAGVLVVASVGVLLVALSNFRDGYTASAPAGEQRG
jgi:hypothetical protein